MRENSPAIHCWEGSIAFFQVPEGTDEAEFRSEPGSQASGVTNGNKPGLADGCFVLRKERECQQFQALPLLALFRQKSFDIPNALALTAVAD